MSTVGSTLGFTLGSTLSTTLGFTSLLGAAALLVSGAYLAGLWQDAVTPSRRSMGWALGQGLPASPEDLNLQSEERNTVLSDGVMPAWCLHWLIHRRLPRHSPAQHCTAVRAFRTPIWVFSNRRSLCWLHHCSASHKSLAVRLHTPHKGSDVLRHHGGVHRLQHVVGIPWNLEAKSLGN